MSSVNDFMHDLLSTAREATIDAAKDVFIDGFEDAANICLGVLSNNIDGLLKKIKSGSYLSNEEQFLLSRLTEIKSETEEYLRNYLNAGNG